MRTLAALGLILATALAGCSDGGGSDGGDDGDGTTTTPPGGDGGNGHNFTRGNPEVFNGTGNVQASITVFSLGGTSMPFEVRENATLVFAELAWNDPVQDINLALRSPNAGSTGTAQNYDFVAQGGGPGMPDSPHSLLLSQDDVVEGPWAAGAFGNGVAANVDFRVAVTVFYGEDQLPDGYTALA